MNCPYCNGRLSDQGRCEKCGRDVSLYQHVVRVSNMYYNRGLIKAKVRNLSGAINDLKKCLKIYKRNIDARNLLGLVYYEIGETVSALSEWVLSKHLQEKENAADYYIRSIQSSPSKLDTISQTIKKYNGALAAVKQGNYDTATLQLRKVVNLSPHYIQALQLLALLYIKNNDMDKARKYLNKALEIDISNTMTLRYLSELTEEKKENSNPLASEQVHARESLSIPPLPSYKEDKPNIWAYVNIIIGIIIGIAATMFLVFPNMKDKITKQNQADTIKVNEQLVQVEAARDAMEKEKKTLEDKIKELEEELKEADVIQMDKHLYDDLFTSANFYLNNDKENAAITLLKVDESKLETASAKKIYQSIKSETFEEISQQRFQTGHSQYSDGRYTDALETLQEAVKLNPDNVDALYFIGRSYHRMGNMEEAAVYYNKLVNDYGSTSRAAEARSRLNEIE